MVFEYLRVPKEGATDADKRVFYPLYYEFLSHPLNRDQLSHLAKAVGFTGTAGEFYVRSTLDRFSSKGHILRPDIDGRKIVVDKDEYRFSFSNGDVNIFDSDDRMVSVLEALYAHGPIPIMFEFVGREPYGKETERKNAAVSTVFDRIAYLCKIETSDQGRKQGVYYKPATSVRERKIVIPSHREFNISL